VFPSLPGDIAADNFGDLLSNIVGCSNVAASLVDDPFVQDLVSGVCEAALDVAGDQIEQQLLDLEVGATEVGQQGLAAQGVFDLVDADQNLQTELLLGYRFNVQWFDPNDPDASNDIAAPITGDGRRAWPVCSSDDACSAGETCQARGSYLRVAQVELGCNDNIGTVAGGGACQGDDECQAGLCTPIGANSALICAQTCAASADCAAGLTCNEAGTLFSLDSVMDGLGDVPFPACIGG
jgi:hypothetical protein